MVNSIIAGSSSLRRALVNESAAATPRGNFPPPMRWPNERVLVIPRSLFDSLGAFQGLTTDTARYLPAFLDPKNNFFLARDDAEEDPSHKQIIPYALFHCRGRFLHYVRGGKSGEKRLADKGSLGIGGHINSEDAAQASLEKDTYLTGVEREMNEELLLRTGYRQRIAALINDDSSPVGQVHIGVVHLFDLESEDVAANEAPITALEFLSRGELHARRDRLETWSAICLEHLDRIMA
jgi:predicted NUDIX family phosphoesterase